MLCVASYADETFIVETRASVAHTYIYLLDYDSIPTPNRSPTTSPPTKPGIAIAGNVVGGVLQRYHTTTNFILFILLVPGSSGIASLYS